MRTHGATRLLVLILSLQYVARIQTGLNSCDRSQRKNSVAATMIFTCHMRRFVAATCRRDVSQRFVASCVSALKDCAETARVRDLSSQSFATLKCECSFKRLKIERNSFEEYSVLSMVSKEEQQPMKAWHNYFFTSITSLFDSMK